MHSLKLLKTLRWPVIGKAAAVAVAVVLVPIAIAAARPAVKRAREKMKN